MGKIIDKTITKIVTEEGISLFRRVTKVLMPNGKYRYPVDYFDATPGVVKVSKEEMDKVAIPVYKKVNLMERLMSDGYPFIFQMIDKSESDEYLIQTLQYRFKSEKSHHAYIVRVECYKKHAYCVKFFDKANINSKNKFSLRSNTFEVRTILYTMFHIMLDVLKRDEKASFFFIGAEDEKDQDGMVSRRFRLYRRFVLSTVSDEKFEHFRRNDLSLYILVNKEYVSDTSSYADELANIVQQYL